MWVACDVDRLFERARRVVGVRRNLWRHLGRPEADDPLAAVCARVRKLARRTAQR